jgi:hypothetical protein
MPLFGESDVCRARVQCLIPCPLALPNAEQAERHSKALFVPVPSKVWEGES